MESNPSSTPTEKTGKELVPFDNSKEQAKITNKKEDEEKKEGKTEEADLQCGICLEPPKIRGTLASCGHPFCFECIHPSSKTSNTCPFCKKRFKQITKIDPKAKNPKKVKVRHADQRPEYEEPNWLEFDGSEDDSDFDERFYPAFPWTLMALIHPGNDFLDLEEEEDYDLVDDFDLPSYFPMMPGEVIDLTVEEFNEEDPVIVPDSPPASSSNRSNNRTPRTNRRNTRNTTPRRSVRRVEQPASVENQRARTHIRNATGRRNVTQNQRQQVNSTPGSLGRRYRIS